MMQSGYNKPADANVNGGLKRVGNVVEPTYSGSSLAWSPPKSNTIYIDLLRACTVEFLGTAIFVFNGVMSSAEKLNGAFGHGFTIVILAFAFGRISGGHFNPAVTAGNWIAGAIHWTKAILYTFVQLLGGFVGALFLRTVLSPGGCPVSYNRGPCNSTDWYIAGGVTVPETPNWGQALVCEVILTFILVQIVLCTDVDTQDDKERNVLAPLAIGFTVFANILAGREISGASMNPARSFGPAAVYSIFYPHSTRQWTDHYVYWAGPYSGAILAALLYNYIHLPQNSMLCNIDWTRACQPLTFFCFLAHVIKRCSFNMRFCDYYWQAENKDGRYNVEDNV